MVSSRYGFASSSVSVPQMWMCVHAFAHRNPLSNLEKDVMPALYIWVAFPRGDEAVVKE